MWFPLNYLASPKKFLYFSKVILPWLTGLFVLLMGYGLVGSLVLAPADAVQGEGFRIIYIHVPCAFLSLFIYAMMGGSAVMGLAFRMKLAFSVMRHSAPLGASFTFLALLTGSLWGKPMWGTWWLWDARLTSELILLFLYLAIILFQKAMLKKRSGDRAVAILVLVGCIDLPIIHYSVYWWNTLHQGATLKLFSPSSIDSSMQYPLLAMIAAFLCYYTIVLFKQIRHELIVKEGYQWKQ
jgi:heme exporter protein C